MKRLRVLLCALLLCALLLSGLGCASEQGQWDEFWKDLRGDNMRMRSDFSGRTDSPDRR